MNGLETATAVADTVLREGHVLYPYRPSALKNRLRWQFGVLGPPALSAEPGADASWCQTEVVTSGTEVRGRVRFLRTQARDGEPWRNAELVELDLGPEHDVEFAEGRAVLRRFGPFVRLRVENTSTFVDRTATRDEVLDRSLIGVHVLLWTDDGAFSSSVDPAPEVAELVAACTNTRLWPVLVGPQVVLACPIILYDNPTVAPESVGQWGDATEIEELLALRVMTLTDEERRAAAEDPFGAGVVDRATPGVLPRLHGRLTPGSTVVLHPRPGADVHDRFLAGRTATIVGHVTDADGTDYVQVVPDDDPGRDLHEWMGRRWFFRPDEVDPT